MYLTFPLADDQSSGTSVFWIAVAVVVIIVCLVFMVLIANFIGLYVQALFSGAKVSFIELFGMRMRKVNGRTIVNARIQATRAGLKISQPEMESHMLAGGEVQRVINAMIAASKAGIDLPWQTATAIDLAGRDILEAVQTSVNPKVIDVPNPQFGQPTIDGVSKDGIQLKVKARVTVRTNIKSLVGGATEETVVARVGEGIVNAIGSAEDYKHVLENPDKISKAVLLKGLDANTAFEILSIDIAEITVGENIGAKLAADRAGSDLRRFQAEAEQRRADGGGPRAGKRRQAGGKSRLGGSGRGRHPQGDGRCASFGAHRGDGLLQAQEHSVGYVDARGDRQAR